MHHRISTTRTTLRPARAARLGTDVLPAAGTA
jgi:hypothetical protein